MENLTAVEWLMKELSYDNGFGVRHPSHNELAHLNEYFDQAKEMEKEQHEQTCINVIERILDNMDKGEKINSKEIFEQYYTQTFNK